MRSYQVDLCPEPFDVGCILQVDIISEGKYTTLSTTDPIDPGLVLIPNHPHVFGSQFLFWVVVTQRNGSHLPTESIHVLHVGRMRMKLCKGRARSAKAYYSNSMQVFQIENRVLGDYALHLLLHHQTPTPQVVQGSWPYWAPKTLPLTMIHLFCTKHHLHQMNSQCLQALQWCLLRRALRPPPPHRVGC